MTENIQELALFNQRHVDGVLNRMLEILAEPRTFEDLLADLCDAFEIRLGPAQYVLVGSTIRSFLSYLKDEGDIEYWFDEGKMWWIRKVC